MVQETKRFLSYICPHCLQSVIVERDLFSLAASINWRLLKKPLERLIASSEVQEQDDGQA